MNNLEEGVETLQRYDSLQDTFCLEYPGIETSIELQIGQYGLIFIRLTLQGEDDTKHGGLSGFFG